MRPKWYPDWRGETIVIVASGPSATHCHLEIARGRARFIAINSSWKLCPWADILFAADFKWWEQSEGCPEFAGLKVSIDRRASEQYGVLRLQGRRSDNRVEFDDFGHIGGSHSGLNALNLAAQLSPLRILLVGYDLTLEFGTHWHGPHPLGLKNPDANRIGHWRRSIDAAAGEFVKRRIEVINCSPVSALRRYPKMGFEEALCRAPVC